MLRTIHPRIFFAALVIVMVSVSMLEAQKTKNAVPQAPLPIQIVTGKKVFIAYGGGDTDISGYGGEAGRTYNQFYAAIKSWGQYEIVPTPATADLVLEIVFLDPLISVNVTGTNGSVSSSVAYDPQLKLSIRDTKSNVLLWSLTRHVEKAFLPSNRDKNFNQAMDDLLGDIKKMVGPTAPAVPDASK